MKNKEKYIDDIIRSYKFHSSHEVFIAFEQIWEDVKNND